MKKFILVSSIVFGIVALIMVLLYFFGMIEYNSWKKGFQITEYNNIKTIKQGPNEIEKLVNDLYEKRFGALLKVSEDLGLVFKIEKNLDVDGTLEFSFENKNYTNQDNLYIAIVMYKYLTPTSANASVEFSVNDNNVRQVILDNFVYYDFNKKSYDRYGNEIIPEQFALNRSIYSFLKDGRRIESGPIVFELNKGSNVIKIKNLRKPIKIEQIAFVPSSILKNVPSYKTFKTQNPNKDSLENLSSNNSNKKNAIFLEAEKILGKNDFLAALSNVQSAQVTPYEILKRKVNVVDEVTFKDTSQEIFWIIHIETPGFYKIGFRYKQSTRQGAPVFRNLYIDGKLQFLECQDIPFEFTSYNWNDKVLPYEFYFDKGYHILSLEVSSGIYRKTVIELQDMVKKIQKIGLDIRKLVGNNLDPNRTWDIEKYIPGVTKDLDNISKELRTIYEELTKYFGKESNATFSDLIVAADLIDKILKKVEKLPFFLDELSEGSSSVVQRLSELSLRLKEQPLGLDKVYIFQGELSQYVKKAKTWLISAFEEIVKFWLSLLNKNESYSVYEKIDSRALKVWINRPVQYVETLQYLIDTDFTRKTGIPVVLSLMPNEQKLVLAAFAGNTPDIAMSISSWIPFELAIRNALYPLSNFPDFFEVVSKDYNIETLLPMVINDKVYGVVETQNFYVLFYRKDILSNINVPIPDTWDDVKKILPELQRRAMNFFIPMCEQPTKYFNTTAPFFFQNDARFYTKDGLKSALNEESSVKSFELMTELFSVYGMPEQVASFYNSFRYGKIPIGVGDFGFYVVLSNAADELYGAWDIAPSPGLKIDNIEGSIVKRYQVAGDRADVIFANSDKKEKAWLFLKWWLSKETQSKFARTLVNRYGPTYLWNTANINAFKDLDFIDEKHKKVILQQWQWIREVQRHPGGYVTEREVSNIWNRVVVEGYPLRSSIDRSVIAVNRELERKLTEFGYIKDGKPVKQYKMYDSMKDFVLENLGERASIIIENQKLLWGENYGN